MSDFVVEQDEAGERLDVVVSRRIDASRSAVAKLIDEGKITVNGSPASKSARVDAGARVRVEPIAEQAPPQAESMDLRFVYEDDHLIVLSKPAGLVVHPSPGHDTGTLVNALIEHGAVGGDPERPGIVHRLDAGTSGLMVVSKSLEAFEGLSEMMAARAVTRLYLALIEGSPKTDTITIDAPIGRSEHQRQRMAVVAGGKDAITHVRVLERLSQTSLVECRLETGRTHQIRVHMLAAEHPVVGDPVYGKDRKLARALELERPFLHATRLRFAHPVTGEPMDLEDPMPEDLSRALERARLTP